MDKKFLVILLAMMMLTLVACGGEEKKENTSGNNTNVEQNEVGENIENDSTKEESQEASFDTSWASNEFEKWIPELPFDGWTVKTESANVYEIELGGLDTATLTDSNGKTTGYGTDKENLITYLDSLTTYGFTVEETGGIEGYEYIWNVTDANGNEIEFTCAEGFCWVTFTRSK